MATRAERPGTGRYINQGFYGDLGFGGIRPTPIGTSDATLNPASPTSTSPTGFDAIPTLGDPRGLRNLPGNINDPTFMDLNDPTSPTTESTQVGQNPTVGQAMAASSPGPFGIGVQGPIGAALGPVGSAAFSLGLSGLPGPMSTITSAINQAAGIGMGQTTDPATGLTSNQINQFATPQATPHNEGVFNNINLNALANSPLAPALNPFGTVAARNTFTGLPAATPASLRTNPIDEPEVSNVDITQQAQLPQVEIVDMSPVDTTPPDVDVTTTTTDSPSGTSQGGDPDAGPTATGPSPDPSEGQTGGGVGEGDGGTGPGVGGDTGTGGDFRHGGLAKKGKPVGSFRTGFQRLQQGGFAGFEPSQTSINLAAGRIADPKNVTLANQEHEAFAKDVVEQFGIPGRVVMSLAAPAYGAAKAVGQPFGLFPEATPPSLQQVVSGLFPALGLPTGNPDVPAGPAFGEPTGFSNVDAPNTPEGVGPGVGPSADPSGLGVASGSNSIGLAGEEGTGVGPSTSQGQQSVDVSLSSPGESGVGAGDSGVGVGGDTGTGGDFMHGGMVTQGDPNSRVDDVPAMLQRGEYVVPRPAMQTLAEKTGGYQQAAQKIKELIIRFAQDKPARPDRNRPRFNPYNP